MTKKTIVLVEIPPQISLTEFGYLNLDITENNEVSPQYIKQPAEYDVVIMDMKFIPTVINSDIPGKD